MVSLSDSKRGSERCKHVFGMLPNHRFTTCILKLYDIADGNEAQKPVVTGVFVARGRWRLLQMIRRVKSDKNATALQVDSVVACSLEAQKLLNLPLWMAKRTTA